MKSFLIGTVFLFAITFVNAQEGVEKKNIGEEHEKFTPHSTLGLAISHAHVFDGRDAAGKKKVLSLPSWGIDYTYHISPKWGVGLHTDVIFEKFMVGGDGNQELERSIPIAPALMGVFMPSQHWSLLFGAGAEFAKEGNYFLNRLGVEYSTEMPKEWEVFGGLNYDFKWNAYDTWVLSIGIAKAFGRHHKE